jgi:hypothetical protein
MPRKQIQARAMLIGALLFHELQNDLEKKENGKRTWVEKLFRMHQIPC